MQLLRAMIMVSVFTCCAGLCAQVTISNISPNQGPTAGGTSVTITGTGFDGTNTTAVEFDGTPGTSFVVQNSTTITVDTPAHAAGAVDVVVVDSVASATEVGGFTYLAAPSITNVNPNQGPAAGGTSVTISGTGFTGVTSVTFGGVAGTSLNVSNDTTLTVDTPAGTAGQVDVVVTHPVAGSDTETNGFTYVAAPSITNVNPNTGPVAGGTSVTISGTGFTGVTSVTFDGVAGTSLNVSNDTTLTITTPAGTAGQVDVVVTHPVGGSDTETNGFTYNAAPTISVTQDGNVVANAGTVNALTGTTIAALDFVITVNDTSTGDSLTLFANITNQGTTGIVIAEWQGNSTSPAPTTATPATGTLNAAATLAVTLTASDGVNGNLIFTFDIVVSSAPTITVSAPNGGENISIGTNFNITWSSAGAGANVEIHLSTDGGGSFPTVISATTANNGSFSWNTTGAPATTQARIRVRDLTTPTTFDSSNANFTLSAPAPAAASLSAAGNPGSRSVSPGSSATALGFRLTETGGSSTFTVTQIVVSIDLLNNGGGVAAAAINNVSLRRGSSTLGTITNGGGGWSLGGNTVTLTYSGLSSNINGGSNADFAIVISFTGGTPPSPAPGYSASIVSGGVTGNGPVVGSQVTGGTLTLAEDLPDDPFAEDDEDSCELSTRGGPAWPALLLFVGLLAAGMRVRRAKE